jgi:mannuronan 5-epimerase
MVPWSGPSPTGETQAGQVHGIMLHRGVTSTVVSNNKVHDQPNGAGIAIFDTNGQTISNNTVTNNLYGIRISVGSAKNTFLGNAITGSTKYGIYSFKGTDIPTYTTASGHPTGNIFSGNAISGSVSAAVNLTETDGSSFERSTYGGGQVSLSSSKSTTFRNAGSDLGKVGLKGTSAEPSSVVFADPTASVTTSLADAFSTADVTSTTGRIFQLAKNSFSASVGTTGSTAHFTQANVRTTAGVVVSPSSASVLSSTGTATVAVSGTGTSSSISLTPRTTGQKETVTVVGLAASTRYAVKGRAAGALTVTSDTTGKISFVDTPTNARTYTLAKA